MPRLVIACDWLPPAFGAVGQYQYARAEEHARAGRPTILIGLAEGTQDVREERALGAGTLKIIRLAAAPVDKSRLTARALWAIRINVRLLRAVTEAVRGDRGASILVTGSPPFFSYLVLLWNLLFLRRAVTYRITDFYPETALASGQASALSLVAPFVHFLRRSATRVEALSNCQKRRLLECGVPEERIALVRDASPVAISSATVPAQRPFEPDDVVLLYSGNLGVAHDVETFAAAYRRHIKLGSNRVRLWLNATGVQRSALVEYCRRYDLPCHASAPAPLEALAGILIAPDLHLVTLKAPFWGYVIPSKIYGCVESGRSVLYIGPTESDVHAIVDATPSGFSIRNGDVEGCFRALELAVRRRFLAG